MLSSSGSTTGHDHLHRLIADGIAAEHAAELLRQAIARPLDGKLVVASPYRDEVTGQIQILLAWGGAELVSDPAAWARVRSALVRETPEATAVVVRVPAATTPSPDLCGSLQSRYLRAGPAPEVSAVEDWTVRRYRPQDRADVRELLFIALMDGYTMAGSTADPQRAGRIADDLLDRADDPADREHSAENNAGNSAGDGAGMDDEHAVQIFCAVGPEGFAGHATLLHEVDDLTARARLDLFDLYVRAPFRGAGPASRMLQRAAIEHARNQRLPLFGHVVGSGEQPQLVFQRLLSSGWTAAESYWSFSAYP